MGYADRSFEERRGFDVRWDASPDLSQCLASYRDDVIISSRPAQRRLVYLKRQHKVSIRVPKRGELQHGLHHDIKHQPRSKTESPRRSIWRNQFVLAATSNTVNTSQADTAQQIEANGKLMRRSPSATLPRDRSIRKRDLNDTRSRCMNRSSALPAHRTHNEEAGYPTFVKPGLTLPAHRKLRTEAAGKMPCKTTIGVGRTHSCSA